MDPKPGIKLSVVIVNYNVKHFLEQALMSVRRASAHLPVEVFVVDNNSVDESVAMVRQKFPEVKLIANEKNVGFSAANNQAIRQARGEYVLLLNPDTVVEEDTFEKCARFMDGHPGAGSLGVRMIDGGGMFLPESKRGLPSPMVAFFKAFGLSRLFPKSKLFNHYHLGYLDPNETHEVEVLSGAFMWLRPYGNARPMTMQDFNAIWAELDPGTPAGAMYRALFLAYTLTGKRRSELLRLHGRDLSIDGDKVTYRVHTKGGKAERRTIPPAVWAAIRHYLITAGRTIPPAEDEPLFVATHTTGGYVDGRGQWVDRAAAGEGAISGTAVSEALKRAAERAGVNPQRVTIHGMRHLAAALWKKAHGNDIRGLQSFLGHSNVATTQVYDEVMSSDERTDYDSMTAALFAGVNMAHT